MKKWLKIGLLAAVCLTVFLLGVEGYQPTIRRVLSERAKEYFQKQKLGDNPAWRLVDLEDKGRPAGESDQQRFLIGDCFSLEVPFSIRDIKNKGDCSVSVSFDSPRGNLLLSLEKLDRPSLTEVPAVQMRRLKKDLYLEEKKVVAKREFVIFQKKAADFEKTAFYLSPNGLFILNLNVYTKNGDLAEKFIKILGSLEFREE